MGWGLRRAKLMPWSPRARLTDALGVAAEPTDALGGQNSLNGPPNHQLPPSDAEPNQMMPWGGRARLTDDFGVAAEPTDALGGQNSLNRPPSHQLQEIGREHVLNSSH